MSSRYETSRYEADFGELRGADEREREISLGTATILGIFFALALVCALFFGFGYSLGRKSAQTSPVIATNAPAAVENATPKSPAQKLSGGKPSSADSPESSDTVVVQDAAPKPALSAHADASDEPQVPQPTTPPPPAPAHVAAPSTVAMGTAGSVMVQVAAVSHQEDADLLVGALKRKGYNVAVRQVPQDKLLHVQIGPFATKKEAVAMQQRLQTDGYNAIVK